ncbi:hypothetical protein [Desulfoluna sp.]|uniref:hypothetical protein n=1 Tax=Desulfoluna sp. TaxID=2045199 RepID=UPI002634DAE9|nr:hypothetical protein [Desulfoluna sp.]
MLKTKQKSEVLFAFGFSFKILLQLVCILLVICILSCISKKAKIFTVASTEKSPNWILNLPHNPDKLYFLGLASHADSLNKGSEIARKDALSQIADYLGVSITSSFSSRTTNSGCSSELNLKSNSSSNIIGAELEDTYYVKKVRQSEVLTIEKFDVYCLFSFSKKRADSEIERKKLEKINKLSLAYSYYKNGEAAKSKSEYNLAVVNFKKVGSLLRNIDAVSTRIGTKNINSTTLKTDARTQVSDVKNILSRVSITAHINGSGKKENAFLSNFISTLNSENFSIGTKKPYYKISANINTVQVGYTLNNYVYKASGKVCVTDCRTGLIVASVTVSNKGFHLNQNQSDLNALEEAGIISAKEIVQRIKNIDPWPLF